jgi:hypothetical protein
MSSERQHSNDQQTSRGRQESVPRRDASERAAGQLDRLVAGERESEQLVTDLGDPDKSGTAAAQSGRAQLRAMTAPPGDAGQIDEMTDAAARVHTAEPTRPRQPWWRRVIERLPGTR